MYFFLDYFFLCFHTLLIIFNVFGWIWTKTRRLNLITLLLTGVSWFVLGIFYGIGYCPLTDYHWSVLYNLGKKDLPNSYIKYLADRITGLDWNANLIDKSTGIVFFCSLFLSIYFNYKSYRKSTQNKNNINNKICK